MTVPSIFARRRPAAVPAVLLAAALVAVAIPPSAQGVTPPGIRTWAIENENADHSYTQAEAVEDARGFDVITALRGSYRGHVSAMRQANPDLRLLAYLNGAFAQGSEGSAFPADWYLRDANGYKIKNDWGLWLMNPAHPGWVDNRARACANFIAESGYDGCSLDNLGPGAIWTGAIGREAINPSTGMAWTSSDWMRATARLASAVKNTAGSRPVYGNGLGAGHAYFDSSVPTSQLLWPLDGGIAETWIRTAHQGIDRYRPESSWKQDVDMLIDAASRGKHVLAVTKVWSSATQAQKDRWHEYALASFKLADNGVHAFTFSGGRLEDSTATSPWWDVDLGLPQGSYYRSSGVYQRQFSNGRVLVNATGSSVTVDLGGEYTDLRGNVVNRVSLAGHTGRLLLAGSTSPDPGTGGDSTATDLSVSGTVDAGGDSWDQHTIRVDETGTITATLGWTQSSADLNLGLRSPNGTWVTWAGRATGTRETISWNAGTTGLWTLGVAARTGRDTYVLSAEAPGDTTTSVSGWADAGGQDWLTYPVEVTGPTLLEAVLAWSSTSADLNLGLRDPSGRWRTWAHAATASPETIVWDLDTVGTWTLAVSAKAGATSFELRTDQS